VALLTAGYVVILKLSNGCSSGATYAITRGAANEVGRAALPDGSLAAVVLSPTTKNVDITVRHGASPATTVLIRLDDLAGTPAT